MFTANSYYVGVDSSGETLKIASLQKKKNGWKILQCQEIPKVEDVNPLYNLPKNAIIVTSLSARNILVRACEIELTKEKEIQAALEFQIEPLIPYPIDNAIVQFQRIKKTERGTSLSIFSVRKDHLEQHLETCRTISIEPEFITFNSYALANAPFISEKFQQDLFLTIHIGKEEVTCALVDQGKLLAARAFQRTHDLVIELQKNLMALSASHKDLAYETILLLGCDQKTGELIKHVTGKEIVYPSYPTWNLSQEKLSKFGLAIAIAIAGFEEKKSVNFRQKEFTYPYPWRRIKGKIVTFFSLAAFLLLSTFSFGYLSLANLKTEIRNQYCTLAAHEGQSVEPQALPQSIEGLSLKIKQLEAQIDKMPSTYPLQPGVPKVYDVLAWLSAHPQIRGHDIRIDSLHYTMLQRPEFNKRNEKYKVKVELELVTENATKARAFHDALLTSNPFIDSASEIQWNAQKDKYYISFILKDKTQYVN